MWSEHIAHNCVFLDIIYASNTPETKVIVTLKENIFYRHISTIVPKGPYFSSKFKVKLFFITGVYFLLQTNYSDPVCAFWDFEEK